MRESVGIRLDPGHLTVFHDQLRDPRPRAHVCTGFASRFEKQRIQCHPPHAQDRLSERPFGRRLDANVFVDDQGDSIERDRPGRQNRVHYAQTATSFVRATTANHSRLERDRPPTSMSLGGTPQSGDATRDSPAVRARGLMTAREVSIWRIAPD